MSGGCKSCGTDKYMKDGRCERCKKYLDTFKIVIDNEVDEKKPFRAGDIEGLLDVDKEMKDLDEIDKELFVTTKLPKLNPSKVREFKVRKNILGDIIALLHLPRMSIVLCFIVIGACLAEKVYWDRVILSVTALALCLIAAYRFDELAGNHTGTRIPPIEHWIVIYSCLTAACIISLYLSYTYSWWIFVFALVGAFFVTAYNLEIWGGTFHNTHWFGISWGCLPLLGSYYLNSLSVDHGWIPAIIMSIFAYFIARHEIWSYGNCLCTKSNYCTEFIDREKTMNDYHIPNIMREENLTATGKVLFGSHHNTCHGQHCWVRLQLPPEVYHLQWKIIKLNWMAIWFLTAAFVALRVV